MGTSATRRGGTAEPALSSFRHEALLYSTPSEFVECVSAFASDGVARGEPVLVVVSEPKIAAVRAALGSRGDAVQFANMCAVGRNPARIIPIWQDFLDRNATNGQAARGVGEPIGPYRSSDAVVECHRHEALINVAFEDGGPWWLMCPYDVGALPAEVIDEARRNHPYLTQDGHHAKSPAAVTTDEHAHPFRHPLPGSPAFADSIEISDGSDASSVRQFVVRAAEESGLAPDRLDDVALVVGELVANALRHARSCARVSTWQTGNAFVCEVRDRGVLTDPLVGRRRPAPDALDGRGLWIVQQLGDLVQQRSFPDEHVVRVHFDLADL
jgi:anti-sigma regulatory factor (Ser/Thr protein kinase)